MTFRLLGSPGRSHSDEWQAIQDFTRSLVLIVDSDALQSSVAARVGELTGADRIILLQAESAHGALVPTFSVGIDRDALRGLRVDKRGRLARWLLTNEACLVVPRAAGVYAYLDEREQRMLATHAIRACVPLVSLNRLVGMILLASDRPEWDLDADRVELLQFMASQAGLAFENASLNREQRDRIRRLDRAERLAVAGQLAAGVAHEIRNPLTAIHSTVQYILQDFPASSPKRSLVEGLLAEIDRIDRTVDGLLRLARPADSEFASVNLAEILDQLLMLTAAEAQSQHVTVVREAWSPDLQVRGDARQLTQVFLNLVVNAYQSMPGGGRLTVSLASARPAHACDGPGGALVRIADTGAGIQPEHLDKVFDPFFTTKREGTGLGLSVSYWIVQRHDGELDLASEPGRGTTVTVRLPLAPAPPAPA